MATIKEPEYHLLTDDDKHKAFANFWYGQELDLHLHTINLARYKRMLEIVPPGSAFREGIQKLHADTTDRIAEITFIMQATRETYMPDMEAVKAAHIKTKQEQTSRNALQIELRQAGPQPLPEPSRSQPPQ